MALALGLNDGETNLKRSYSQPDVFLHAAPTAIGGTCQPCKPQATSSGEYNFCIQRKLGEYKGQLTPNFTKRKIEGELLKPTSYLRWDYWADRNIGAWSQERKITCGSSSCWYPTTDLTSSSWYLSTDGSEDLQNIPNALDWDVNTDALLQAAIANCLPDLDILTTAAEMPQSIRMLLDARKSAKDLIIGALRGGKYTAKAAADAWLAWRYGWQQLGRDVVDVYNFVNTPVTSCFVTGRSGDSHSSCEVITDENDLGWVAYGYTRTIDNDVSVRANAYGSITAKSLNPVMGIPKTAWELIPYSFVADWFVDIGNTLASWEVQCQLAELHTSIGVKQTVNCLSQRTFSDGSNTTANRNTTGYAECNERFQQRFRVPAKVPPLVPSINVKLTGPRITDAAALLAKRIF